jgi:chromosome segregation ATPase
MDEKVKQLAETLKKNGLAASEYEAIDKAKSILNVKSQKTDTSQNQIEQPASELENKPASNLGVDIKDDNKPLKELMKEANVPPEQVETQEQLDDVQEKIEDIKEDIKEAEKNPEKIEQVKEEIEKVKEDIAQVEEAKKENKNQPQEDRFKEEKKIDLTKVFNHKNDAGNNN